MTNEELLEQLLEEVKKLRRDVGILRKTIDSQSETIEELRTYINNNSDNEIINNAREAEIKETVNDIVYGNVQANPNEPKSIVLSNQPKFDDKMMYGTDEDNYYRNLDKKVAEEYLDKDNEKNNDSKDNNDNFIKGTNILKPRERGYLETDEEYVKYLEEYYAKNFPDGSKSISTINNNEPKELAVLDDVKKPEEIEKIESAISDISNNVVENNSSDNLKEESNDIYSNSDGTSASIISEINSEKNAEPTDRSEVIEFASEEEKEAFERGQAIDYKKDSNSKTEKISNIRKAIKKFKNVFKKHGKKIIAGLLVAAATIGGALSIKSCTYDKAEDLKDNNKDPKSNADEYDSTIPSKDVADSFGVNSDDIINKIATKNDKESSTNVNNSESYDFDIGETVHFNGDYIYKTANDAVNDTNRFIPDYSKNDSREISAIEYVSPNGSQHMTAVTKEEQDQLQDMGWKKESYNMKNNTRSSDTYELKYEGWVEPSELTEVKSK